MSSCKPEISVDKVREFLRFCRNEAKNPRNDGWVQSGYISDIQEIFSEAEKILLECKKNDSP